MERTFTVKVHDSIKEVGGMATLFLENFSKSSVSVDEVMKDFLVGCYGTADERQQVIDNRKNFTITSYSVGPPRVTVNFGGLCPSGPKAGDACSESDVRWRFDREADGGKESVSRHRPGRGRLPRQPLVAVRQQVRREEQRLARVPLPRRCLTRSR